jgi:hypothetical protein
MVDASIRELARAFAENGNYIERIPSSSAFLFSVFPFSESFLGWDRVRLSHFTVWDCLPIVELKESDVLSGGRAVKTAVQEAVAALQGEEDRVAAWKSKHRMSPPRNGQMEWL